MHTLKRRRFGRGCRKGKSLERDCCCTVATSKYTALEGGVVQMMVQQQSEKKNDTLVFPWLCVARRGGTQSLEKEPARATLDAQGTRHGARRGPNMRCSVPAGPPHAPLPRAPEKTDGRWTRACNCTKRVILTRTKVG